MRSTNDTVYLDYAATTPVAQEVTAAMLPFLRQQFGNPSNMYSLGRNAKAAVEQARRQVANFIGALPEEIVFTSGGTEADNLAVIGAALRQRDKGRHVVTTAAEHAAVLRSCGFLETLGFEVTRVAPDSEGRIDPDAVFNALRDDTVLVSVMHANNETGVILPVEVIGFAMGDRHIPFHVDAVQSAPLVELDVSHFRAGLLSLSAHKLYGPKGVGALYVRRGTPMLATMLGGSQEAGRRAGTENVAGIVGFGKACELTAAAREANSKRLRDLRDQLWKRLANALPDVVQTSAAAERLPSHLHVRFPGVEGQTLMMNLDLAGVCVSTGSACSSGSAEPSHVLQAMGLPPTELRSSLRYSLGRHTTEQDVACAAEQTVRIVQRMRRRRLGSGVTP